MVVYTSVHEGQQYARTRWGTNDSGAAFDRKKFSYLTEQAREFISQQGLCVIGGLDTRDKPGVLLAAGLPGFVETPDERTCVLRLYPDLGTSRIVQGLRMAALHGRQAQLGLFFICHPTRERLCVHGTAEILSSISSHSPVTMRSSEPICIRLHVHQSFFHCSKYIKTRIPGLTVTNGAFPHAAMELAYLNGFSLPCLVDPVRKFIAQQLLCFLCTVDRDGQPAVNHRGGAAGFLLTLPPDVTSPGGIILLPDYAGNGAFEAIGNIFETGKAALLIPNYIAQIAVCATGSAYVLEPGELAPTLMAICAGAERIIALSVERVEIQTGQNGEWAAALAYETTRAGTMPFSSDSGEVCSV
jgi:uncharacterized protein